MPILPAPQPPAILAPEAPEVDTGDGALDLPELHENAHHNIIVLIFAGLVALLIWSGMTTLTGVTRAAGLVVSPVENQIVQHLEGGIVSEILVKEGDTVELGQTLLRIEDTTAKAELKQVQGQILARKVSVARIDAELAGVDRLDLSQILATEDPADYRPIVQAETDLFALNRQKRLDDETALDTEITEQELTVTGLEQARANQLQTSDIVSRLLEGVRRLQSKGGASQTELLQIMRAAQEAKTKLDEINSNIARAEAALTKARNAKAAGTTGHRAKLVEEKLQALVELAQAEKAAASLRDRAARSELRAPVAGVVQTVMVTTVGGVVAPGQAIVEIVPQTDTIAIEARLSPRDRAQIWPGTKAVAKISAYDYSVYGGVEAVVTDISPGIIQEKDSPPYFRVQLAASNLLAGGYPVVPGMTVTVDMETKDYTVLDYLLSPVINTMDVALRQ